MCTEVDCDGGAGAGGAIGGNNLGLSGSNGATSCLQGGTTSPACATSDGSGNGGTGAPGGMAVSAVTYLAAPVLMEHLHVKPQIVALTTTVRSQ